MVKVSVIAQFAHRPFDDIFPVTFQALMRDALKRFPEGPPEALGCLSCCCCLLVLLLFVVAVLFLDALPSLSGCCGSWSPMGVSADTRPCCVLCLVVLLCVVFVVSVFLNLLAFVVVVVVVAVVTCVEYVLLCIVLGW